MSPTVVEQLCIINILNLYICRQPSVSPNVSRMLRILDLFGRMWALRYKSVGIHCLLQPTWTTCSLFAKNNVDYFQWQNTLWEVFKKSLLVIQRCSQIQCNELWRVIYLSWLTPFAGGMKFATPISPLLNRGTKALQIWTKTFLESQ